MIPDACNPAHGFPAKVLLMLRFIGKNTEMLKCLTLTNDSVNLQIIIETVLNFKDNVRQFLLYSWSFINF